MTKFALMNELMKKLNIVNPLNLETPKLNKNPNVKASGSQRLLIYSNFTLNRRNLSCFRG